MYKKKRSGPKMNPWGTVHRGFPGSEKDLNHFVVSSKSPINSIFFNTGWSKKSTLFCFSSQSCVLYFFHIFWDGVDSRPGSSFWHQYGPNWRIYYIAGDKNHQGILCHKISSSDTVTMQKRFWQEQCTW